MPVLGIHLLAIRRSSGCPVGDTWQGNQQVSGEKNAHSHT